MSSDSGFDCFFRNNTKFYKKNLSTKTIRVPKVQLIMKTENSFSEMDASFFSGSSHIFYNSYSISHSGNFFPAELQLLAQHPKNGKVRAYTLSLDDLCGSSFRLLRANLTQSWEGPTQTPIQCVPSPKGSCMALLDCSGSHIYSISVNQFFHLASLVSQNAHFNPVLTWLFDGQRSLFFLKDWSLTLSRNRYSFCGWKQ